jgi:pimeloyl-ACP methyl ester carboxylesterase
LIPILPQTIFDTRDGDYELLTILADFYLQNAEGISQGMYLSVQCGEEVPFTDRDAAIAAAQADPMLQEYNEYTARSIFASCDAWGAPSADVRENTAVQSGVPALVLAGEFDPITPPSWGRAAAEGLSNGHFFEYPGLGHGVSIAHECPRAMVVAFLGSPNQAPPSLCIGAMSGLDWVVE